MDAIILAGGLGTRLRSVISDIPKCMAPVAGKPFLSYLLTYLSKYKINRVILSVGYLREVIFDWMKNKGADYPFEIEYAIEEEPLGTGGGIRLALQKAQSSQVAILNGDTFFDVDLDALLMNHIKAKRPISLALKPMRNFDRYGSVELCDIHNEIVEFKEKSFCKEGLINGGLYVMDRDTDVFDALPPKFSFETEVLQPQCLKQCLSGFVFEGYFIDIGIPSDYQRVQTELLSVI